MAVKYTEEQLSSSATAETAGGLNKRTSCIK